MKKSINFYPGCLQANVCIPPIYEELLVEEKTSVTGSKCFRRVNDVYLLLNQDRLDKQSQEEIIKRIERVVPHNHLSALRSKLSDKDLCQRVKSRYIQSRAELQNYMEYLMHQDDLEKSEQHYKKLLQDDEKKRKELEDEEKKKQQKTE